MAERAVFRRMDEGTEEDWRRISAQQVPFMREVGDRVLDHLRMLGGDHGGFAVDRLTHSLQTVALAEADGRDDEYLACALLHDVGDLLAAYNHPDIAAALLKPFVREEYVWMVANHGVFQGYYFWHHIGGDRNARDRFRDHPWYDTAAEFCELYDQRAFDPDFDAPDLDHYVPLVRRVFAEPKYLGWGG